MVSAVAVQLGTRVYNLRLMAKVVTCAVAWLTIEFRSSRAVASQGWRSRPFASTAKPSDPVRGPCMVGRMLAGCASSEYKEAIWQLSANCRWRLWTSFFHPVFAVLIHWQLRSQGEWKCKMPQPQTQYTFYSNFDGRPQVAKTYSQGGTDYQIMSGGGLHRGDSLRLT